jgi:D-alanine-D-alanine ligase
MQIGLSYDLKDALPLEPGSSDDALEEYDSAETVEIIASVLEVEGHSVVRLGGGSKFLVNIRHQSVDIVFNISEGRGSYRSREAQVPSILEMLDIPYTGSDPQCLAICLDKPLTKQLMAVDSISTPKWLRINNEDELCQIAWDRLPFPAIIKPAYEGSSKGIRLTSLVYDARQAQEEARKILDGYRQPVMVEEFIDGGEVTVGIIGNSPPKIVGIMSVIPKKKNGHFIYSLEVKRDYLDLVDYECPALLAPKTMDRLVESSLKVFKVLGCRDFARIDFRVSSEGIPYFIEINPLPGLGTYSDLIIMAKMMGWKHEEVISAVLDAALERYPQCVRV